METEEGPDFGGPTSVKRPSHLIRSRTGSLSASGSGGLLRMSQSGPLAPMTAGPGPAEPRNPVLRRVRPRKLQSIDGSQLSFAAETPTTAPVLSSASRRRLPPLDVPAALNQSFDV